MAFVSKQEERLMDEFIERTVLQWVRMILARQPMAEFVFIATKEDLITEYTKTEKLFKNTLKDKLAQVEREIADTKSKQALQKASHALPVRAISNESSMDSKGRDSSRQHPTSSKSYLDVSSKPSDILFVSCTLVESVRNARERIEALIVASERNFRMPYTYSRVLQAIGDIKKDASNQSITARITQVFAPLDPLVARLPAEPKTSRVILQTLHDLGDILWYEDLGVEMFCNTVILDPLLLIDFIRQVINHNHKGQTMPHDDLIGLSYWRSLSDRKHTEAMKQVLHKFHLVYSADDDREMRWDSDMIVPAYWQTKTPAAWLWLGDDLRIKDTKSFEGEAVRVHRKFHFETGLPLPLFSHVIVASVSAFFKFDAGPDWIVFEEKGITAARILVGRDPKTLHRTIHVEAVVSEQATAKQTDKLWAHFVHFCSAFFRVLKDCPGLVVSSFAWDHEGQKVGLRRVMQGEQHNVPWLPPPEKMHQLRAGLAIVSELATQTSTR